MLISQAVYAAFCESFVDSCQQFDEQFKEKIIRFVHEWLTGTKFQLFISLHWRCCVLVVII
jgi:Protein of unknown function